MRLNSWGAMTQRPLNYRVFKTCLAAIVAVGVMATVPVVDGGEKATQGRYEGRLTPIHYETNPATLPPTPAPTKSPAPSSRPKPKKPTVKDARAWVRSKVGNKQFACIDQLWYHESRWNPKSLNRSSGAYGIPQALPGDKMASAGSDWKTNPLTQVKWGLGYINGRYGSGCGAWEHFLQKGWY